MGFQLGDETISKQHKISKQHGSWYVGFFSSSVYIAMQSRIKIEYICLLRKKKEKTRNKFPDTSRLLTRIHRNSKNKLRVDHIISIIRTEKGIFILFIGSSSNNTSKKTISTINRKNVVVFFTFVKMAIKKNQSN